jgi:hypothetical protein
MQQVIFPKRFEIEGINPLSVPVKLVRSVNGKLTEVVYENFEAFQAVYTVSEFSGPMACKLKGEWCVRFECHAANRQLSA